MGDQSARSVLRVAGLAKSFGAVRALDGVDIDFRAGRIHGIIGPNGSGKTTLFDCITGILHPDSGRILFCGEDITRSKPHAIAAKGIRRTFQAGTIVPGLTVLENVMAGVNDPVGRAALETAFRPPFRRSRRETEIRERAVASLEFVGVADSADKWGSELVWAERQLVQIARAMVAEPRLLLLDEPVSGMGSREMERVGQIISAVRDRGITPIVVSHDVKMLMSISEVVTVLSFGRTIAEDCPAAVKSDPRVVEAYLGAD